MFDGITQLLSAHPYTLDMPTNPEAVAIIEQRFVQAGLTPLLGDSLRFERNGFTTLIGKKGSGSKRLALVAHYDIAPDDATWQIDDKHQPVIVAKNDFVQHMDPSQIPLAGDTLIVGKGVADMIGAAEAMLQAAQQIPDDFPAELVIIATPDEEIASPNGMIPLLAELDAHDLLPDVIIGAESTFMDVLVRRRGGYYFDVTLPTREETVLPHRYRITTHGTNMHPGIYTPEKRGLHAHMKMAQVLGDIGDHQVLEIRGGDVVNVIPNRCEALVATSEPIVLEQLESGRVEITPFDEPLPDTREVIVGVRNALEAIGQFTPATESVSDFSISVSPNLIDGPLISISSRVMQGNINYLRSQLANDMLHFGVDGAEVTVVAAIQPFFSDPAHPAIATATQIVRDAGWDATGQRENHGTSDLNFLYDYPSVLGFEIGPVGANEHGANEWACLDSLMALPGIYVEVLTALAAGE